MKRALLILSALVLIFSLAGNGATATTYTVTDFSDGGGGTTLRSLIAGANNGDTINFSSSYQTITLTANLTFNTQLTIDGGTNHVTVSGPAVTPRTIRLFETTATFTISNLCLINAATAIYFSPAVSGNSLTVTNCIIGIGTNDFAYPNTVGVNIIGAMGGLASIVGNTMSANTNHGVSGSNSNNIQIYNNSFGTDSTGMIARGNQIGITLSGCSNCIIGSNTSTGNIISANLGRNLGLFNCNNIQVFGNIIGLNATLTNILGNSAQGIALYGSNNIAIGKPADTDNYYNIIVGCGASAASTGLLIDTSYGNTIQANYIGFFNNTAFPNTTGLVLQNAAAGNLIGGLLSTDANIIAGNSMNGINFAATAGSGNTISGNYIGWYTGSTAVGNGNTGIAVSSPGNLIGGNDAIHNGNMIIGNPVKLFVGGNNTSVVGNHFGCTATLQTDTLSNLQLDNVSNCTIGGPLPGDRNYFCGLGPGISIVNLAANNRVINNWINVLPNGLMPAVPMPMGIWLNNNAAANFIGNDLSPTLGNLIGFTGLNGILADGAGVIDNAFYANTICAFSNNGIVLINGANGNKAAPTITIASPGQVSGTSTQNGDIIEVFLSDRGSGVAGGSLQHLAYATTSGNSWSCPLSGVPDGAYVCAIATQGRNSSPFSQNFRVTLALPSPTITPTVTATATPIITTPTPTSTTVLDLHGKVVVAYPNPGKDKIQFLMNLDQAALVKVMIYNLKSERMAVLSGNMPAGACLMTWDCSAAPPGIYVARVFKAGQLAATIKVAVFK